MNQLPIEKIKPESVTEEQTVQNRKKALKTAVILAVVALGFFAWSVYIVLDHAKG